MPVSDMMEFKIQTDLEELHIVEASMYQDDWNFLIEYPEDKPIYLTVDADGEVYLHYTSPPMVDSSPRYNDRLDELPRNGQYHWTSECMDEAPLGELKDHNDYTDISVLKMHLVKPAVLRKALGIENE